MAVRNGESFIAEQVASILDQLGPADELIVSDDHSTDSTLAILNDFADSKIRIVVNEGRGIADNFENALACSKGDIIFLADQDDWWHPTKIQRMTEALTTTDLVVCDCKLVDETGRELAKSFFSLRSSGRGLLKNLVSNSYMGCCMAFRRNVLEKALPFPRSIAIHDFWIGLVAEANFRTSFLPEQLVNHRIHSRNATTTGRRSDIPPMKRISQRCVMLKHLIQRSV